MTVSRWVDIWNQYVPESTFIVFMERNLSIFPSKIYSAFRKSWSVEDLEYLKDDQLRKIAEFVSVTEVAFPSRTDSKGVPNRILVGPPPVDIAAESHFLSYKNVHFSGALPIESCLAHAKIESGRTNLPLDFIRPSIAASSRDFLSGLDWMED